MKRTLILASMLALSAPAMAADVTITSGYEGGSYHGVFGRNLAQILTERGHAVTLMPSKGSEQNLERVAAGEAQVGFSQADAYAAKQSSAEIVGSLGKECLFVVTREGGGIDDESALQAEGVKIGVGEKGSGSALSWDYARQLEDGYAKASTYYQGGVLALAKVKSGQLDAFFFVTSPGNMEHKFFKAVNQGGSGLRFIDFNDWDMNDTLPTGDSVYDFTDVVVDSSGFFETEVEVPCTSVLTVASRELDGAAMEDIATALMMNSGRITGK